MDSASGLLSSKFRFPIGLCSEEDVAIAERIRAFVDAEVMPRRHDLDGGWEHSEARALAALHHLHRRVAQLGVFRMCLPPAYGGTGASAAARIMVSEELARGDAGLANMVGKVFWVSSLLLASRRDDLLREFAPKLLSDPPYTACVAITEPGGGANIEDPAFEFRTLRTRASLDGDTYVISGEKIWPGPAGPLARFQSSDLAGHLGYWTVATTDPEAGRDGVGVFYVPPDAPGLRFSEPIRKMGMCWTDENARIFFDGVRIPKRYRLDTSPGQGAALVSGYIVAFGRLASAAYLVGIAQAVLEIALEWTGKRFIGGFPVREHSGFAMILGEMFRAVDSARQYVLSVTLQASRRDIYGPPYGSELLAKCSAARSLAGDACEWVLHRAMELMGAYGYAYDNHVEKYLRDFEIVKLWLGGPHRDRLEIAQALYGPFQWPGQRA